MRTITEVRSALTAVAVREHAAPMASYMKDHFAFLGVKTPERRAAVADLLRWAKRAAPADVFELVDTCWAEPEREFQYVGADALKAAHGSLGPEHLERIRSLVAAKSWWDTVDTLASWPVGSIVARHPDAVAVMDEWLIDDDFWVARTAILHQLRSKDDTDVDRLFRYALTRAGDDEFFIRKAIGWSLRQYAHRSPDAVATFVADHRDRLSALTAREATKHL